jgi:uncharacterized phage-associated protein
MKQIRFKFAPAKVLAAIHWMVCEHPDLDLHTLLKACYFADKKHLNQHRRPVFGATYKAMRFGPVPIEIYEMAKGENYWLAELGIDRYPWRLDGFRLRGIGNEAPDLDVLSESDLDAIKLGLRKSSRMTFNERTADTHGPDWQAADLDFMRYEDMIEDSPDKEHIVAYLRETSRFARL